VEKEKFRKEKTLRLKKISAYIFIKILNSISSIVKKRMVKVLEEPVK
jgi:hypothetical protein